MCHLKSELGEGEVRVRRGSAVVTVVIVMCRLKTEVGEGEARRHCHRCRCRVSSKVRGGAIVVMWRGEAALLLLLLLVCRLRSEVGEGKARARE